MDVLTVSGVRIAGVVSCVPTASVDVRASLHPLYGEKTEDLVKATGIVARRVAAPGESALDLCVTAAQRVLTACAVSPSDIGAVVFVSFTQDRSMPCAACQAQSRLGLPNGILALDLQLACSGWTYGLYVASLLARETKRKVLLLDGDVQSTFLKVDDAATLPVLADAGTATLLESSAAAARPWRFAFGSYGEQGDALVLPRGGTISMDGFGVFRFVSREVSQFLRTFLSETELADADLDAFVPHQANVYMIRQLTRLLGLSADKLRVSCDRLGNSASATIPTTLALSGTASPPPRRVLCCGFGGGLSIGAVDLSLDDACVLSCADVGGTEVA